MEEQIARSGESIILEDFNIRTNDKSDKGTINLLDFKESFDLGQPSRNSNTQTSE